MSALEQAWYSGAWWLWLLRPVEVVFRLLAGLRRGLFQVGLLRSWRAPCKVVVVGNITVGGTGKTPVVAALVEHLQASGVRVGVVSRGYGGNAPDYPYRVTDASSPEHAGDEPLLLQLRTGVPVMVSPDRARAARELLATEALDLVISDDGLQHYALQRDLELVLVDGERRFGNGFCLPAGPLREPVSRLARADFVLTRGGDQPDISYRVEGIVNLVSGETDSLERLNEGAGLLAVAGIGQPGQFYATLREQGLGFEERTFPDHYPFTPGDFGDLADRTVIMTEKDAVKCRSFADRNWWYLKISAQLPPQTLDAVTRLADTRG